MDTETLWERFEDNPIIAAVKNEREMGRALETDCGILFLLFGDLCGLPGLVKKVHERGRLAFVHVDLVQGLSAKDAAADYLRRAVGADGIISTRPQLLRYAKSVGLATVLRVFLVDSMSLANLEKMTTVCDPDFVEVLPGIMPRIITKITASQGVPVITGGLVESKEDVMAALSAGAMCVSTTCEALWRTL